MLARYDRFIAAVDLAGTPVEAHCVNPGRMEGLVEAGSRVWVSQVPADSKRKLRYTLEMMEINGVIIGVNTVLPNYLAETLVRARLIPGMKRFRTLRREVRYGSNSRIDLLLGGKKTQHYVEVKNCHLVYPDGGAYFPDSVSTRAAGHLRDLAECVRQGDKASVLFTVQRNDGRFVRPSDIHDPAFAQAARDAFAAGVRFYAARFAARLDGFKFLGTLPVDLKPYDCGPVEIYRSHNKQTSGWQRRGKPAVAS